MNSGWQTHCCISRSTCDFRTIMLSTQTQYGNKMIGRTPNFKFGAREFHNEFWELHCCDPKEKSRLAYDPATPSVNSADIGEHDYAEDRAGSASSTSLQCCVTVLVSSMKMRGAEEFVGSDRRRGSPSHRFSRGVWESTPRPSTTWGGDGDSPPQMRVTEPGDWRGRRINGGFLPFRRWRPASIAGGRGSVHRGVGVGRRRRDRVVGLDRFSGLVGRMGPGGRMARSFISNWCMKFSGRKDAMLKFAWSVHEEWRYRWYPSMVFWAKSVFFSVKYVYNVSYENERDGRRVDRELIVALFDGKSRFRGC